MTTRPPALRRTIDARLGLSRPGAPKGEVWAVRMPRVVSLLAGVMAIVFAVGLVLPKQLHHQLEYVLGFVPARFGAAIEGRYGVSLLEGAGPLVSHAFLHGNFAHLAMNAVGLAIFGTAVARRLRVEARGGAGPWNTALFVGFFLASAVAGALVYAGLNAGSAVLMVGASGGISGLMAAAIRFALRPFAPYGPGEGALSSLNARPVVIFSAVYVGFNLLTPLGLGTLIGGGLSIAWEAHVGGYLFGLVAFSAFDKAAARPLAVSPDGV